MPLIVGERRRLEPKPRARAYGALERFEHAPEDVARRRDRPAARELFYGLLGIPAVNVQRGVVVTDDEIARPTR